MSRCIVRAYKCLCVYSLYALIFLGLPLGSAEQEKELLADEINQQQQSEKTDQQLQTINIVAVICDQYRI